MEVDLKLWGRLRGSWCEVEQSATALGDTQRAALARQEIARTDKAIGRLEGELRAAD